MKTTTEDTFNLTEIKVPKFTGSKEVIRIFLVSELCYIIIT